MPTLNKLEYLDETKQQIKNALNTNFNSQIQDTDTFRSYVSKINNIYTNWAKVTGEGTALNLTPTKKGRIVSIPKGATSQHTTTGKNKYNATKSIITINAVTHSGDTSKIYINGTPNGEGRIFFNKTYLEAGTYTFSMALSSGSFTNGGDNRTYLYLYKGTEQSPSWNYDARVLLTPTKDNVVSQTFTISEGGYYYLSWHLETYCTWTNAEINYQVESGSSFTSFEEYTGGQPSPSPDYPQPIKVVTGDQNVAEHGKNLFDKDKISIGYLKEDSTLSTDTAYRTSDFMSIRPNTTYYKTSTGSPRTKYFDINKIPLNTTTYWDIPTGGSAGTFTTPNNAYYLRLSYPAVGSSAIDEDTIMIKEGTDTTYKPYQGATYPVNLGTMELCKIGTYQDYIRKSTGKNLLSSELETGGISEETGQNSNSGRTRTKDYIDIQPNTEYTLSADYQGWYIVYYYNESQTFISSLANNSNKITFTTPSNVKYLRCVIAITNAQNVMLNPGQTALPYEPYGTSWYLNKQIGKVVLDGNENVENFGNSLYEFRIVTNLSNVKDGTNYAYCLCDKLKGVNGNTMWNNRNKEGYNYLSSGPTSSNFLIMINNLTTTSSIKSALATLQPTVYYVLNNPTDIPITDTTLIEQLNNLYNATSQDGTTIITCSSASDDNEIVVLNATALMKGGI